MQFIQRSCFITLPAALRPELHSGIGVDAVVNAGAVRLDEYINRPRLSKGGGGLFQIIFTES